MIQSNTHRRCRQQHHDFAVVIRMKSRIILCIVILLISLWSIVHHKQNDDHFMYVNSESQSTTTTTQTNTTTATTARRKIQNKINKNKQVIRWAMSGGGWRSLFSNIGFLNTFRYSGLLDLEKQTFHISAVSTNSGSTWLLVQMAYSQIFFQKAVPPKNNTNDVYQFIIDWLNSLRIFFNDNYPANGKLNQQNRNNSTMLEICKLISPLNMQQSPLLGYETFCLFFSRINFNWANLIDEMFLYASTIAYNDTNFKDMIMNETNRIPIFQNTDLYAQIAVLPVSKIVPPSTTTSPTSPLLTILQRLLDIFRIDNRTSSTNLLSYIGPKNIDNSVFTVPIPSQYIVTSNGSRFVYAIKQSMLPFQVYTGPAPNRFRFSDWESHYLYNENYNNGSIITEVPYDAINNKQSFIDPFDGVGTVTQIAAASSASLSDNTGAIPAFVAQRLSVQRYMISNSTTLTKLQKKIQLAQLLLIANLLYSLEVTTEISVCDVWPKQCQKGNYRLVDGAITDGPSVAMNVGQYHRDNPNTYKDVTMKVILTNSNYIGDKNANILNYFSTYFNQGIKPGEFIWAPGVIFNELTQRSPYQNMQIFKEYMDDEILVNGLTPTNSNPNINWNITTGIYNCTTVNNPVFGVKAGQKVLFMLIRLNSAIPTNILSNAAFDTWTEPMAAMTLDIATDPVLAKRIRDFALL